MSTDLEFLHDLSKSKTKLLTVKTTKTTSSSTTPQVGGFNDNIGANNNNNNNNNNKNNNVVETQNKKINIEEDDNKAEEEDCCRTPTSKEHRIPKILDCPPAPRKPKRAPTCKRKLSDLQFFEIVNRDEVDSFFRSSFEQLAVITSKKRNCCSCK
nr:cyclin-dependent protein kinase inhibitor SMR1-like [Quercus suber]